jgi:hypothetical protein
MDDVFIYQYGHEQLSVGVLFRVSEFIKESEPPQLSHWAARGWFPGTTTGESTPALKEPSCPDLVISIPIRQQFFR